MSAAPIMARAASVLQKVLSEQRSHQRYPIELEAEYRLLSKSQRESLGSGKTRNISSGGVLLKTPGSLTAGSSIEVMVSWPFLLEGVCPLRLVMRGRIVRSDGHGIAIQANYHEFRTAGSRIVKGKLSNFITHAK